MSTGTQPFTAALVGNPNVGKTTLFNALTGAFEYVGNWAGVTVTYKEGFYKEQIKIVDLPGIYAMDTFSNEEKVAKTFLEQQNVDVIINIVDASNLQRNLYLTMQLKLFNKPILVVLNMLDAAKNKGITIDPLTLEKSLGCTVVPIIASQNIGIDTIGSLLEQRNFLGIDSRDIYKFEDEASTYRYIESITDTCISPASKVKEESISRKLDHIFLHPWLAYPLFICILFVMFQLTFAWIGVPLQELLDYFVVHIFTPFVEMKMATSSEWFRSLIIDGIIAGVGSVIVFLPILLTLFTCIAFLEESGYMARVAFIMDKLMRKIGLSGKAFIPLIIGFGCSVPAVMATKTLETEKDRKITALIAPFMSCNARLPVYTLFAATFFKGKETFVVMSLYLFGVIVAFIMGLIFKHTLCKKEESIFIIELPEYKLPTIRSLSRHAYDKAKDFLKKVGTLIFSAATIIWFLSHFGFSGFTTPKESFLYGIGHLISPIFIPLGFGNWQASVALITGLLAKEAVVGSLGTLYGGDLSSILSLHFSTISAYSFLIFVLLYTPCVAVIGAMKKEYGTKMAFFSVIYQFAVAWIMSFLVYQLATYLLV